MLRTGRKEIMSKIILFKQFFKYAVVGILATALDFSFLYVLVEYGYLYYLYSALISSAIIIWISFILNKYWTFQNKEKKYFHQFTKYVISHLIALAVALTVLAVLVEIFHFWYLFAKVFATIAAAIVNFLLVKKFIFFNKQDTIIESPDDAVWAPTEPTNSRLSDKTSEKRWRSKI